MKHRSGRFSLVALFALVMVFLAPGLTTASPTMQAANLALGKTVTTSSLEGSGFEGSKAVDGNATSRWASVEGVDPQWIRVDLGASYAVNRVVLKWEAAYGKAYRVETSADGSAWTAIYSTSASDGTTDDLAVSGSGRYVRVYGTARGTAYGYSLFELEVYGATGTTPTAVPPTSVPPTAVPTTSVPPTTVPSGNIAKNKPATASSIEAAGFEAAKAVDGSTTTRWASAYSDPQWIYVDLGASYAVNRVVLKWEAAYGKAYRVETSANASTWTAIYSTSTGNGATDDLAVSGSGRYVRVYGTVRGTAYGYSLFELEVYSSGATPTPITPTPVTPTPVTPTPITPTPVTPTPVTPTPITPTPPTGTTPAAINGQLRVCGTKLCNQYGKPIQLRGMSTHGLQWYGWGSCITSSSLDALANNWKADILRISLYVQEGGYETNPAGFRAQVDRIIDEVTSRGMYALIDWHMLDPGDPYYNLDRAKEYFTYMAQKHGNKTNILYEIANEPSEVSWSRIKSYAEEIIPVIRSKDSDAVIIVGTPDWSSFGVSGDGGRASTIVANPVNATNILYTFHFYAASHLQEYRDELSWAADRLPVFVTEWGSQEYTGDGPNDFTSAQAYIDIMAQKKISWTSWNYSDDERSGAAFKVGTCGAGGPWSGTSLKPAGTWVRDKILNPADNFPTN